MELMQRTTQFLKRIEEKFKIHRAPKYFSLWSLCHFVQKASSQKQNKIRFLRRFSVSISIIGWIEMVAGGGKEIYET